MREKWLFSYKAEEVQEAAAKRAEEHERRRDDWEAERVKADIALREKGTELRSMPVTGGERIEVVLDRALQSRLEECNVKVREHANAAGGYRAWERAVTKAAAHIELDISDVAYFGL